MNPLDGIDDRVKIDKSCIYLTQAEWDELEKKAIAAQKKASEESAKERAMWTKEEMKAEIA